MRYEKIVESERVYEFNNEGEMADVLSRAIDKYFGDVSPNKAKVIVPCDDNFYLVEKSKQKGFLDHHLFYWNYCELKKYNGKIFVYINISDKYGRVSIENYVLCVAIERAIDHFNKKKNVL